jgi:hypothetical protein
MDTPSPYDNAASPPGQPQGTGRQASGCGVAVGAIFILTVVFGLFILFHPFGGLWWHWSAEAERKKAETARQTAVLDAAQDTASLFIDALRNEDGGSAYALLSSDFRERLSAQERKSKTMNVPVVGGQRLTEWKFGGGKLSGDEGRATFSGSARSKNGQEHSYRLVVVKESRFLKGGSWRVDLFTVQR